MIKKIFGSTTRSFDIEQPVQVYKRKSAIQILPANDDDKSFKKSIKHTFKTIEDESEIRKAIEQNEFISHIITDNRFQAISRTIYSQEVQAGETIIQEGEIGSQLFISALGEYEVTTKSGIKLQFDDVRVFGELALLYNVKRKATVRAITKGKLWVLDNQSFKEIIERSEEEERNELVSFLSQVPTLNTTNEDNLRFVADLLSPQFFPTGTEIIKEGKHADAFYILRAGSVRVKTKNKELVTTLTRGQFFGESALINEESSNETVIAESPGCECLTLSRKYFIKHFGEVSDFQKLSVTNQLKKLSISKDANFVDLKLEHFNKIRTIGAGGFGSVDIIQHKTDKNSIYALKYIKKYKYVLQEQRDHILNEKNIQLNCHSPFIVRLYKTFKDTRFLYFLMEAQLGGDLWRLMYNKRRKPFMEDDAKFYVACVIEAFEYLHERGIVYRDLKPENVLIGHNGYVKLTDFGFAKIIGTNRTNSLVGTPDYIAPEILCNKSHDRAVDCWALGILIFELLTMKTPFQSKSSHDTYKLIMKGIVFCRFPYFISSKCKNLIMKLCSKRPVDRIGNWRNGMKAVKSHYWFSNFNWNHLKAFIMRPPYTPKLTGPLDLSNFPHCMNNPASVPEVQTSTWDEDF
ncbi:hypothetical protein WA026_006659 [Henosepilachna vigintioctopunctata]|uniref:cGMP-dependent protein kinase n=1 Tax=Henosepilachna vigintioctopunctata TaxID=420089 RepID=A0AAW1UFY9_9CUCU